MGKVAAMAALLDCSDDRIARIRNFAGVEGNVFVDTERERALSDAGREAAGVAPARAAMTEPTQPQDTYALLQDYCIDQVLDASSTDEHNAAQRLNNILLEAGLLEGSKSLLKVC
tara:strand:- start:1002 stop:1346 length:345 start_codon:yes stop_codon:yes gene_type:complete